MVVGMRELKFEIMFELHNKDFTKSIGKHYTTLDRIIDGRDNCDYSAIDIIANRQYTGLKDTNGKEIYEGDVVYIAGYGDYLCEFPFTELCDAAMECDIGNIIGNIHENPELLEG